MSCYKLFCTIAEVSWLRSKLWLMLLIRLPPVENMADVAKEQIEYTHTLLNEIRNHYFSERCYLLKNLISIFRIRDDEGHFLNASCEACVTELLSKGFLEHIVMQYKSVSKAALPSVDIRKLKVFANAHPSSSDDAASYFKSRHMLQTSRKCGEEQVALLELLCIIFYTGAAKCPRALFLDLVQTLLETKLSVPVDHQEYAWLLLIGRCCLMLCVCV